MDSDIDARLHDHVALAEIELYVEVLIAVATADRSLTLEELDEVLGVLPVPGPGRPPAGPGTAAAGAATGHGRRRTPRHSPR